ncbi:MAG: MASE3 domain-containing protein [Thermodesulforhabdaceae bacterium]
MLKLREWIPGLIILIAVILSSLHSFLLYHSLVELFSSVIGFTIFVMAWNLRDRMDNNYLLFIGIAYFFVALVDLLHTLAYKGMGVFIGFDANLPTQLWITARYLESLSLLIAPFFLERRRLRVGTTFLVISAILSIVLFSIFYLKVFPDCFIEGKGLTAFKKVSEYIICGILAASLVLLLKKKDKFPVNVLNWLIMSIVATIIQELAFTFYVSVYGLSNFIGHIFKVISFYFVYKGIVETGLKRPYEFLWRELKQSEEKVRQERDRAQHYLDIAGVIILVIGTDGRVQLINKKGCEILGYTEDEIIGKDWFENFIPEEERHKVKSIFSRMTSGEIDPFEYAENMIITRSGEKRIISWHNSVIKDGNNQQIVAVLSSGEDITERRRAELEKEKTLAELKEALEKVKVLSGLIPICAGCKKVRTDEGYWIQVEAYIKRHSEAEFTHSLCPECLNRLYPDLDLDEK